MAENTAPIVGITPTHTVPAIDALRSTTSLRAASRSTRTARGRAEEKRVPSSVRRNGAAEADRRAAPPSSSSSLRICCESDGCETVRLLRRGG